jgi:membrane-bound lytic murein transglycosylase B
LIRLIIALILMALLTPSAAAKDWIACQVPTGGDEAVTDMFTDTDAKWRLLTKRSRSRILKAKTGSWIPVRTKSGVQIQCRVWQRTPDTPAAPSKKATPGRTRGYHPAPGKPAPISPEKISVSERMKLYLTYIEDAAEKYRIPISFIKGVIRVESNFNYRAQSPVGAMGLMQLMPRTATFLGVSDAYDPRQNIMGGTKFLRRLANRYKGDMVQVLSAYNAGPGAVAKKDGTIPFPGAERYVRAVLKHYYAFKDEHSALKAGDGP